eukprot:5693529-Prymnesium_polylepis.1
MFISNVCVRVLMCEMCPAGLRTTWSLGCAFPVCGVPNPPVLSVTRCKKARSGVASTSMEPDATVLVALR